MEWALTIALAVLGVGLLASAALQWKRIRRGATELEDELEAELQALRARWNERYEASDGGGYLVHAEAEEKIRAGLNEMCEPRPGQAVPYGDTPTRPPPTEPEEAP